MTHACPQTSRTVSTWQRCMNIIPSGCYIQYLGYESTSVLISHLVSCCGTRSLHNGHIRDLNGEVAIVNEWPCALYPARLKLIFESAQVRVPE